MDLYSCAVYIFCIIVFHVQFVQLVDDTDDHSKQSFNRSFSLAKLYFTIDSQT